MLTGAFFQFAELKSSHYSILAARHKLELLRHLPPQLPAVVLLDSDTICVGRCADKMQAALNAVAASKHAFFTASKTAQFHCYSRDCYVRDSIHRLGEDGIYGGKLLAGKHEIINSGVMAFDLRRFRAFEQTSCPGRTWWACVIKTASRNSSWANADQGVWNQLIRLTPDVWQPLACGVHAEASVLVGIGIRLGLPLATSRSHWLKHSRAAALLVESTLPTLCDGTPASNASSTRASAAMLGRSTGLGAGALSQVRTMPPGVDCEGNALIAAHRVAFTHGAAHSWPLAHAIALRLTYCAQAPQHVSHSPDATSRRTFLPVNEQASTVSPAAENRRSGVVGKLVGGIADWMTAWRWVQAFVGMPPPTSMAVPLKEQETVCQDVRSLVPCRCFASTRAKDRRTLEAANRCIVNVPSASPQATTRPRAVATTGVAQVSNDHLTAEAYIRWLQGIIHVRARSESTTATSTIRKPSDTEPAWEAGAVGMIRWLKWAKDKYAIAE